MPLTVQKVLADIIWILNLVEIREQRHSWPQFAIRRRHAPSSLSAVAVQQCRPSIDREPGDLATASKQGWELAGDHHTLATLSLQV